MVLTSVNVDINHLTIHPLSVINFSDHLVISFCLSIDVPSVNVPKPGNVFDFRKADFESILYFLLDLDFSPILESFDIEIIWSFIKSSIYKAMSLFTPKVLIKRCKDPKWFDSDIRHNLTCLRTLKRKFKSRPTSQRGNKMCDLELLLQSKIVNAKTNFKNNLIESRVSSSVFSYIYTFRIQS